MQSWMTAAPAIMAAFVASLVEVVEAFTIVLAVGITRGWRGVFVGTAGGLALLAVMVTALGPVLEQIPLHLLQFIIGVLLLLFGLRWLRKAILRAAARIALHDEELVFRKETAALASYSEVASQRFDWIGSLAAFKAVVLEGLEVVFIVIAVGGAGRGLIGPASLGAAFACVVVLLAGALIHKPLARVPENTLKFGVGVMLSAFGVFWTGEGLGVDWPGGDLAVLFFAAVFLAVGVAAAAVARQPLRRVTP